MGSTVELPLWLVVVFTLFTALVVTERLLLPSMRWFWRRRISKALDEINRRLNIKVQPFKLTRRRALVDLLMFDARVVEAIDEAARETGQTRQALQEEVRRYALEIVPAFDAFIYYRFGYWLARKLAHSLYKVRIGHVDYRALGGIDPSATVVFVMNHRSNMDYILAAFLAADHAALSYAVGEWANVWPIRPLIRGTGAYFIRRKSRSPLYRRVLERYVDMATRNGVSQAVFPEGGLSRDGRMQPPRMGIVDYMLRGFDPRGDRDIVFVPVALNYDRVLEDRTLLRALDAEAPRIGRRQVARTFIGFVRHHMRLAAEGRWHRFGYAGVNFGRPLSVRKYLKAHDFDFRDLTQEARFAAVEKLVTHLMRRIGQIIPVTPVPLVASVLAQARHPLSDMELKKACQDRLDQIEARGGLVTIPRNGWDHAINTGLIHLEERHLVLRGPTGLLEAAPGQDAVIAYYANSLAPMLGDVAAGD